MTKKNRHFKKSRKNVRRKRNQVGGAMTTESIANLSKIATTGIDVIITLTEKGKCHTTAVQALKAIVEESMKILTIFKGSTNYENELVTVQDKIKNILENLNKLINVLTKEDISSMVELLWNTLDKFGDLVQQFSQNLGLFQQTVSWVEGMETFFGTYAKDKDASKVTTIDVSIAKLLQAQLTFANEYMGNDINVIISATLKRVNDNLNAGATEWEETQYVKTVNKKVEEYEYNVLKVLIASLVCTLKSTTEGKWDFKAALVETCTIISYLIEGKIFKQSSFYNTLQAFASSVGLFKIGASFSLVFAAYYVSTYAKSFTDSKYKDLKTCSTLKALKDWSDQKPTANKSGPAGKVHLIESREDRE